MCSRDNVSVRKARLDRDAIRVSRSIYACPNMDVDVRLLCSVLISIMFAIVVCDECVHSLNGDLDLLKLSVVRLDYQFGNLSTTALTGARLKRIHTGVTSLLV